MTNINSRPNCFLNAVLFYPAIILATFFPAIVTIMAVRWEICPKILYPLGKIIMLAIPVCWWKLTGLNLKEIITCSGIKDKKWWIGFPHGLIIGLAIIAFYYLVLFGRVPDTGLKEKLTSLGLIKIWPMAILVLSLFNSAAEEYYWRSFLYPIYTRNTNELFAVLMNGSFFMLHHLAIITIYFPINLALLFTLGTGIGGILWADLRRRKISIFACWISHAIIDLVVMGIGCISIAGLIF